MLVSWWARGWLGGGVGCWWVAGSQRSQHGGCDGGRQGSTTFRCVEEGRRNEQGGRNFDSEQQAHVRLVLWVNANNQGPCKHICLPKSRHRRALPRGAEVRGQLQAQRAQHQGGGTVHHHTCRVVCVEGHRE